jgi:RNA polymerase sigma-70 factor (ECF subfamily)
LDSFAAGPGSEEADGAIDTETRRAIVRQALRHLPEKERAALVLRDIEGLTTAEVAAALGSSEGTVRSQISTARGKLRGFCEALLRRRSER